jgi:hypothetical protein
MTTPQVGISKSALEQTPFPSQDWDDNHYSNRDAEHFQFPGAFLVGIHVRSKVNRSVWSDKPGQSSEMVTYKKDRTFSPETSCKILRADARGAATELELLCDGEGQRKIRQRKSCR